MDRIVNRIDSLRGDIYIPPSKSYSQRALLLSLLTKKTLIRNLGSSEDERASLNTLRQLGSRIDFIGENQILIENGFSFNRDVQLDCGESGLLSRLYACFMVLNSGKTTIRGRGSLAARPMNPLSDIYQQLEFDYEWKNGRLPLTLSGTLNKEQVQIDGSLSSQFVSGMMYAFAGMQSRVDRIIYLHNPKSIPYIEMTIHLLRQIGVKIDWGGSDKIVISPSNLKEEIEVEIEGDWSSAAFWVVAAAIKGDLTLKGLNLKQSLQADRLVLDVIKEYGSLIEVSEGSIQIVSRNRGSFHIDATHCPDLIPILSVLAFFAEGESTIAGIHRLEFKESNRLHSITDMLSVVDANFSIENDMLKIKGGGLKWLSEPYPRETIFNTYSDHRIVMASSILALFLNKSTIKGIESVDKSYPKFFKDLDKIIY